MNSEDPPGRGGGVAAEPISGSANPPRKRIDRMWLEGVTATVPPKREPAADLVRTMRDTDRY